MAVTGHASGAHAVQQLAAGSADRNAYGWTADLGCPGCGYNLRGLTRLSELPGVVVDCPECGLRSDLAELARRRWDKPWYKAPGFNRMTAPVAWLLLGSVGVLVAMGGLSNALGLGGTMTWLAGLGLVAMLLAGWVLLLAWVYLRYGGFVGVLFSLLAHAVFAGYVGGLALVVSGVVVGVMRMTGGRAGQRADWLAVMVGVGMLLAGVVLFVVGRILERQVAGHCIRLYLRRGPG